MPLPALESILASGEDSRHQFKRDETNADSIAAELAAFANSGGGLLLLGVDDSGKVSGLDAANVRRLNQLISNAASQNVRPPVHPTTENIQTAQGILAGYRDLAAGRAFVSSDDFKADMAVLDRKEAEGW